MPNEPVDPDIEGMCEAAWNVHGNPKWGPGVPADKDFYRRTMGAALDWYLDKHKYDDDRRED